MDPVDFGLAFSMYDLKVNVKLEQYNCKEELKEVSKNFKFTAIIFSPKSI